MVHLDCLLICVRENNSTYVLLLAVNGYRALGFPSGVAVVDEERTKLGYTVKNIRMSTDILWRVYFNGTGSIYVCIHNYTLKSLQNYLLK